MKSLGRFFFMIERRAKATFEPIAILSDVQGQRYEGNRKGF